MVAALAVTLLVLGKPQNSLAVNNLDFQVMIGATTCIDNDACDTNPAVNRINFTLTTADSIVSAITSVTNAPGGTAVALLDMGYVVDCINVLCTGGTVVLKASVVGFTSPTFSAGKLTSTIDGNFSFGSGSVTAQQWENNTNTLFGEGANTCGPQGPLTSTSYSSTCVTLISPLSHPFALTEKLTITLDSNPTLTSGDFSSTITPEPASMLLMGIGLVGLGSYRKRSKNKN